jgi:hypothetical protein
MSNNAQMNPASSISRLTRSSVCIEVNAEADQRPNDRVDKRRVPLPFAPVSDRVIEEFDYEREKCSQQHQSRQPDRMRGRFSASLIPSF